MPSNVGQPRPFLALVFVLLLKRLLQIPTADAGDAICDPKVSSNTTRCACDESDEHCSFPSCIDSCTCAGGGCVMDMCIANCICPGGGCQMSSCLSNCDNGGEASPPVCVSEENLDPSRRGVWTPAEVCTRAHGEGINATVPYVCAGTDDSEYLYACCNVDVETIEDAGMDLGECFKDLEITGDVFDEQADNGEKMDEDVMPEAMTEARYRPERGDIGHPTPDRSAGFVLVMCILVFTIILIKRRQRRRPPSVFNTNARPKP